MRIFIPFIMNMTLCVVYSLCIEQINIYKPIAHMNISTGILFRLSIMVMFLTLLIGMLVVRFTKRKYLMVLPIIMPILLWSTCINIFPYRSFVYMGISACKKRRRLLQQNRSCCYSSEVAKLMFFS